MPSCLNPFENQVYFYARARAIDAHGHECLNPFENQVYFYSLCSPTSIVDLFTLCLNPFENQVYFYMGYSRRLSRYI